MTSPSTRGRDTRRRSRSRNGERRADRHIPPRTAIRNIYTAFRCFSRRRARRGAFYATDIIGLSARVFRPAPASQPAKKEKRTRSSRPGRALSFGAEWTSRRDSVRLRGRNRPAPGGPGCQSRRRPLARPRRPAQPAESVRPALADGHLRSRGGDHLRDGREAGTLERDDVSEDLALLRCAHDLGREIPALPSRRGCSQRPQLV